MYQGAGITEVDAPAQQRDTSIKLNSDEVSRLAKRIFSRWPRYACFVLALLIVNDGSPNPPPERFGAR